MDKLITPLVIHCDETKMKIEKLDIGHLTSNDKYNGIFFIQKEKFKGIAVHDKRKSYNSYECANSLAMFTF